MNEDDDVIKLSLVTRRSATIGIKYGAKVTVLEVSDDDVYVNVIVDHPTLGGRQHTLNKFDSVNAPPGTVELRIFRRNSPTAGPKAFTATVVIH